MSSFQYSDNFSGFNDLINRVEFLEEKTYKQMVKAADLGSKLKAFRTEEGGKIGANSRVKNLIIVGALVRMNLINTDIENALRRKATSSTHIIDTLKGLAPELYDELFEGDNPRSLEVVDYIDKKTEELIPYAVKNFTRAEYDKRTEEELRKVDFEDVADDARDDISKEVQLAKGLVDSDATDVTLDFDDVDVYLGIDNKDEVAANIVDKINKFYKDFTAVATPVGLNIEGPIGAFGGQEKINDQMNRLITKYFPAVEEKDIQVALNTSADEDFEQSLYGGGGSYKENELPSSTQEEDEIDDLIMNNDKEAFILTVTDNVKRALKKALNRKGILFNDVEEGLTVAPEDHSIALRVKDKISSSYAEEEEFRESYTDGYMSDQSSSDKRNKKKKVLSESFKDRYKPKTHWQLEELRRYGL